MVEPDQNEVTGELPDGRLLVTNRTGTYRVEKGAPFPCVSNAAGGPCRPVQCIDGQKCEKCGRPVSEPTRHGRWLCPHGQAMGEDCRVCGPDSHRTVFRESLPVVQPDLGHFEAFFEKMRSRPRDESVLLEHVRIQQQYRENCCPTCGAPDCRPEGDEVHDCREYVTLLREQVEMWKHLVSVYDTAVTGLMSGAHLGGRHFRVASEFADGLRPYIQQRGETLWATPQDNPTS